jgi:glutathione synthase/RimK-type ligase-like ATP-grasp enzyme
MRTADFKPAQLVAAADLGFTLPPTLITNVPEDARMFIKAYAPVVYKAFRGVTATGGMAGAIWTQRVTAEELDESITVCPHLFQAEVSKGADVRVTVVGTQVFAFTVRTSDRLLDWRAGDWDTLVYEPCEVPDDVRLAMLGYLNRFGLEFGCFDFVIGPDNQWNWLERNPNGQWGFLPDAPRIAEAIADLLQEG